MRFAWMSDLREYRVLVHDPSATVVWDFEPKGHAARCDIGYAADMA